MGLLQDDQFDNMSSLFDTEEEYDTGTDGHIATNVKDLS